MKNELEHIVKEQHKQFCDEFSITDFPKLYHVLAMIETESQWNQTADSGFQRGLMQVSEQALKTVNQIYKTKLSYDDMFDPAKNVFVGIRYMRWLYRYFAVTKAFPAEIQIPLTIMSYNWGIGNIVKWVYETKKSNSFIDEQIPDETKQHLLDWIFWQSIHQK